MFPQWKRDMYGPPPACLPASMGPANLADDVSSTSNMRTTPDLHVLSRPQHLSTGCLQKFAIWVLQFTWLLLLNRWIYSSNLWCKWNALMSPWYGQRKTGGPLACFSLWVLYSVKSLSIDPPFLVGNIQRGSPCNSSLKLMDHMHNSAFGYHHMGEPIWWELHSAVHL